MTDTVEQPFASEFEHAEESEPVAQSGAALFPELVWAHFCWQRERHVSNGRAEELEQKYVRKLSEFQSAEGQLKDVYWSTRDASAVAMTVMPARRHGLKGFNIHEPDAHVHLHRVSDWVTRDTKGIADLLQECDLLAIRVGEVLRGTTELIALRGILGVQAHLLGFMERGPWRPEEQAAKDLVRSQRQKLAQIETFYHRAASKAGRIVYVSGMITGIALVAILGVLVGLLLWASQLWQGDQRLIVLCFSAGALGALVSAMSRMGKPETGRFNIDFELGRPLLRRLGFFRPFVGAIFGVALFFLLSSGIVDIRIDPGAKPYYYGFAAFLAGFSERYTTVVFGTAERALGGGDGGGTAKRHEDPGS